MWKNRAHTEFQDASMTDFIDASGFRANVGIVLVRGKGDVFLGGRTGGRGWQFPQGGIGRDEDPEEGMFRELKEEIGLEPGDVRIIASTRGWLRYRLPAQYLRRNARQTCIGQKQRWFMLEMISGEDRFRFDTTATPEFESWRWVDYWAPVREVIYFKRAVYARALDELGRRAFAEGPPPLPAWWEEEKTLRNLARRRESQPQ